MKSIYIVYKGEINEFELLSRTCEGCTVMIGEVTAFIPNDCHQRKLTTRKRVALDMARNQIIAELELCTRMICELEEKMSKLEEF